MKAVILAGGKATRLYPLTLVTNKHLLPVYDKPMIYYAIEKLVDAGIDKIMIVTSPTHLDNFVSLLGSGQNFKSKNSEGQIQIVYGIQNEPGGVAQGLCIAKEYIGTDNCILYLGDNIFEDNIREHINNFKGGGTIFLKEVLDPRSFGVAEVSKNNIVMGIEEKPKNPKSNMAVTGLYIYDNTVFNKMVKQPMSDRKEYEITYVNNKYLEEGTLRSITLEKEWFDLGTIDSLMEASIFFKKKKKSE